MLVRHRRGFCKPLFRTRQSIASCFLAVLWKNLRRLITNNTARSNELSRVSSLLHDACIKLYLPVATYYYVLVGFYTDQPNDVNLMYLCKVSTFSHKRCCETFNFFL